MKTYYKLVLFVFSLVSRGQHNHFHLKFPESMTFERITNLCLLSADTYIGLVGLSLRLPSAFTSESSSNILPSKTSLKQSFPTTLANCKLQTKAFNYRKWKSIKIKFKIHLNHPSKQLFCDKMMFIFKSAF